MKHCNKININKETDLLLNFMEDGNPKGLVFAVEAKSKIF